ncbi:MAG: glycosyltransferase [Thermoanaerobaculia bacterium]
MIGSEVDEPATETPGLDRDVRQDGRSEVGDATSEEGQARPRVRTAIAVLMTRFPRIDETFILREINELERHGQPVLIVPLLRGDERSVHEEARPWIPRALYTPFLSAATVRSNVTALLRRPLAYLGLLFRLIAMTIVRPSTLIRTLAFFPKSVHLSVVLPARGVKHVHAHFASHATTAAYIISSLSGISYSFTVHGPEVFVHRVLLPEKIRRAKFIRSISVFNKAFLCGLYPALTEDKIAVVPSGVNPDLYADALARSQPRNGRIRLLSVAALTPSHGFPFLVDACARLAKTGLDFECDIVGEGPLRATTERWIARQGLAERIHLVGTKPQHELARLMAATDIFVLPSIIATDGKMDGIPISLMEAMAAGKPVIASSISGIPELVQEGVSGLLVDSAHTGRLAEAVQLLAVDRGLAERLAREGQSRVRNHFNVRSSAVALIALFDGYATVNDVQQPIADRVRSLRWEHLGVRALGVRRVHQRSATFIAEVQISDGVDKRDAIVRRPRGEDARERARAEYAILSTLRERMGADATYIVPRLLLFDEPHAALVLERADGRALASCMRETNLRHAGAWLRSLQRCTREAGDGRILLRDVLFDSHRDLERAAVADPWVRRRHHAIRRRMRALEARVTAKPIPIVGQHGSFRPENIFIGEGRVWGIDFGAYRRGFAEEDVAQMLLFVDRPAFRRAFLEGYGEPVNAAALHLFTITKAVQMLARAGASARERRKLRRVLAKALA